MKQYVIWKGIASVEIPDSFQAATIGEKEKYLEIIVSCLTLCYWTDSMEYGSAV